MKSKRIIAGVLAATVCFTMIPMGAFEISINKVVAETVNGYNNTEETEKNDIETDVPKMESITSEGNISETIEYRVYDETCMVITGYGTLCSSDIDGLDKAKVTTIIVEDKGVSNSEVIDVIKSDAFFGYTSLESLILPEHVRTIDEGVFKHCPNLSEITIPMIYEFEMLDGTMYDPYYNETARPVMTDILGCESVKKVTIITSRSPYNEIPHKMFEGLTSLEEVVMSEDVAGVGYSAFKGCSSLTKINLPESLRYIGYYAFESCSGLAEIKLPSQLREIGGFAFSGCSSLKEIAIPDEVVILVDGAFSSCENLSNVVIGKNASELGEGLFKNCPNLREITMPMDFEVYLMHDESDWYYEGVRRPLVSDILGCEAVEKVTITNGEEIPCYAFSGCASLKSVVFPSTVEIIQGMAFSDCTSLESVTIPSTVKEIRSGAFKGCTALTDVTFEDGVEEIYDEAFAGCTKLSNINFGNNVTYLGDYAFRGCTSLKKVIVPDSIKALGLGVFAECESLESAVIGNGMIQIGESVFRNCYNLKELTMPLYNVIIDTKEDGYFYPGNIWVSWNSDNEVRLAKLFDGMRDPDQYALRKLNITSMENSNVVTAFIGYENGELVSEAAYGVPENLFEGMSMLTDIVFGDTVMSVSADVFSDCINLENLTFKAKNVYIEADALLETDAVVHCYEDSMVHKYVAKNNLSYILLEEDVTSREVGDLNNDGVVELTDLTILSLYLIGDRTLDKNDLAYADMTGNGEVNIADLAAFKQYIMKS